MKTILLGLLLVPILAQAQPVNYFDKNGKLFMQAHRVNNQVIYTDPVGNLVASSVATPVLPPLTPNLASPKGRLAIAELPLLPVLPTLEPLK